MCLSVFSHSWCVGLSTGTHPSRLSDGAASLEVKSMHRIRPVGETGSSCGCLSVQTLLLLQLLPVLQQTSLIGQD